MSDKEQISINPDHVAAHIEDLKEIERQVKLNFPVPNGISSLKAAITIHQNIILQDMADQLAEIVEPEE